MSGSMPCMRTYQPEPEINQGTDARDMGKNKPEPRASSALTKVHEVRMSATSYFCRVGMLPIEHLINGLKLGELVV